jgi:hypothetical protein
MSHRITLKNEFRWTLIACFLALQLSCSCDKELSRPSSTSFLGLPCSYRIIITYLLKAADSSVCSEILVHLVATSLRHVLVRFISVALLCHEEQHDNNVSSFSCSRKIIE